MRFENYRVILFDWGDTLMRDDPTQTLSMLDWPQVQVVAGVDVLLEYLVANGYCLGLATGAAVSTESQIRGALARVSLDRYIEKIYCFGNTAQQKPSAAFYQYILDDLGLQSQDVLMLGDSFEKDVLAANRLGIDAVWYNPLTSEVRDGEFYCTIHHMTDLLACFQQSDHERMRKPAGDTSG